MTKYQAEQVWEMDKAHFIHPYTNYATFEQEGSQIIAQADGMYIKDDQGNRFLDGIAGLWCVNIGHGRQEMADTIAKQVLELEYYNPFGHSSNQPGAILAAKLAELAPGDLNHVFFTCGGSTAVDSAIRLVHYYNNLRGKPNKKQIIARNNAYHGSTYVAANLTGIHATKFGFDRIANQWINHISAADMHHRPAGAEQLNEADYCQFLVDEFENRVLQLGADNVAAFIAEPVMGAGGVLVAPAGYHKAMKRICDKYDLLYIADEVVTSFGRLGHFFASEAVFGMQPDIIITAKGISSGYIPLGAAILSERIYRVISQPQCENGVLSMGFTYTGHPVACASALKNIEIMEREGLCQHVQDIGPYFQHTLKALSDIDIVADVRGHHLMLGIELAKPDGGEFPASCQVGHRVFEQCRKLGLIVRPIGNVVVLSPPLIIQKAEIDTMLDILKTSIKAVAAGLTKD